MAAICIGEQRRGERLACPTHWGMEYGDLAQEAGSSVARSFPAKEGNLNELAQEALLKKVEELKIPVEYKAELKSVATMKRCP